MKARSLLPLVTLLGLAPAAAHAQVFSMVVRSGSPRERDPGGVGGGLVVTSPIGLRDCESEVWRFVVSYPGNGQGNTSSLQYFIGADTSACGMANQRHPVASGSARCWPVSQTPSLSVSNPTIPLNYTVEIQARYLVDPLAGNCATPGTTQGVAATNYLTLLAFPPSDSNIVGTFSVTYDVQAPVAPENVVSTPGESSVNVGWSYGGSSSTTTTETDEAGTISVPVDLQGFWLLCDPPPGAALDGGVSDGGDAGPTRDLGGVDPDGEESGDAGTCGGSTALSTLDPNNSEQFERYRCSNLVGATATRGTATGLVNGRLYRVAVVAQDLAGNRSTVAVSGNCVRPQPVTDFWEHYRVSGGRAQPGLCAVGGAVGSGGLGRGWWCAAGMLGLWLARRARRRLR